MCCKLDGRLRVHGAGRTHLSCSCNNDVNTCEDFSRVARVDAVSICRKDRIRFLFPPWPGRRHHQPTACLG